MVTSAVLGLTLVWTDFVAENAHFKRALLETLLLRMRVC